MTLAATARLFRNNRTLFAATLLAVFALKAQGFRVHAQSTDAATPSSSSPLTITKIDPPNWFAGLPKPMLLVNGTGLGCASFTLSDSALHVERTHVSTNGHWAQVYLSASPGKPETVTLRASCPGGASVESPYTFAARRSADSGMAGFDGRDSIYLIMTDRFADGDLHNDGADARAEANSAAAAAQRQAPMGWHGGDLPGVEKHLDYLQNLGVTTVWLTPVYQNHSPVSYHGYHATDYFAVDEHFGTLTDLQSLAAALHRRGMKLVLDTVPNHTGPNHPWAKDEPTENWYHGTVAHHLKAEYNFDALVNPHAPERDRVATLTGWFVDELPDNDTNAADVALYQRQNAIWWIEETGADGLRIDTFPYVDRAFWNAFNGELKELYPRLTSVGEVSTGDTQINSAFADGVTRAGVDTKLYTPFDYPMYYAMLDVFGKQQPFSRIASMLEQDQLYPHPERLVTFLGNHDQIRLATLIPDRDARRLAMAFLLTSRGTPEIYSGEEIAMTGGEDPANRTDFPGGFPGAAQDAFNPASRTKAQSEEFDWVQHLLRLRAKYPQLACGAEQVLNTEKDTFVFTRYGTGSCASAQAEAPPLIVMLQRGPLAEKQIDLHQTKAASCGKPTVVEGQSSVQVQGERITLHPSTPLIVLSCASQ